MVNLKCIFKLQLGIGIGEYLSLNSVLFCFLVILFFSCSTEKEQRQDFGNVGEKYDSVSLNDFKINGLKLFTSRDSLKKYFGNVDKQTTYVESGDSVNYLYFFKDGSEIAFYEKYDEVWFYYLFFKDSEYELSNEFGTFSRRSKLDPFKLIFTESMNNLSAIENEKTLWLKVDGLEKSWIRLKFLNERLTEIYLDKKG